MSKRSKLSKLSKRAADGGSAAKGREPNGLVRANRTMRRIQ